LFEIVVGKSNIHFHEMSNSGTKPNFVLGLELEHISL
jgi:hypothetical protein